MNSLVDDVTTFVAYDRVTGAPITVDARTFDPIAMSKVWPLPPEPEEMT